jgi:methionyl-tRNA synthetase
MNIYLTTPIYYASGSPHLGHAYTSLLADCYKRYRQLRGDQVLLATGTDEHGQKIERTAAKNNVDPKAFVDARSEEFRRLWSELNVSVDVFERTTAAFHKQVAVEFWERLVANGDIYRGDYSGLYCVECEQYFTTGSDCPVHKIPLGHFSESSWFFRLSRYRQPLINHIESNPEFIVPRQRRNEVLSFLRGNQLWDLSVSRSSTSWGIRVPGDPGQVLYVWVDALVAYLSALARKIGRCNDAENCLESDQVLRSWWSGAVHFIGKDILNFHAVYWPAFLLSAGLPLPGNLVVNGWLTVEGEKISKSKSETIINPLDIANEFGTDALKYYFLRTVGLGADSDFSLAHLKQTLNSDLANNLGNLVSRVTSLVNKYHAGCIKNPQIPLDPAAEELLLALGEAREHSETAFDGFDIANAASVFINCAAKINAFLQHQAPWKIQLAQQENQPEAQDILRRTNILWVSCLAIRDLAILATPFVPGLAQRILDSLGIDGELSWDDLGRPVKEFKVNHKIKVFQRLV